MKRIHALLAIALVVSLSLTSALADSIGDKAKPLSISLWIKGATAGTAVDVTDGKNIYVVEFWATWCGYCREAIPHLSELQREYKERNVVFIGISDESAAVVKPFVEEQGEKMEYIVALDKNGATNRDYMSAYDENGIPCAFVINRSGQVVWVGHPMSLDWSLAEIVATEFPVLLVNEEGYLRWEKRLGSEWILESASSLAGPWNAVSETPATVGYYFQVEIDYLESKRFFRLRKAS